MDTNEFAQDRTIDPNELDIEAIRQADVYYKWAQRAIEARVKTDKLKLRLDVTEASLASQCREKPESFGIARVTESAITAAVKSHDSYVKALLKLIHARERQMLLDRAVDALEQRKRMIEVLVTLHGQQYFAGPSIPKDLIKRYKEYQANASANSLNDTQKAKLKKRKRKGWD